MSQQQQSATIGSVMQANAEQAVRYARERFKSELDFTPASLDRLDKIIDVLHVDLPKSPLTRVLKRAAIEQDVWTMAKQWGAYAGETFRRTWGGRWKTTPRADGHADIVLELPFARCEIVERVRWRLAEGAGERVVEIYLALQRQQPPAASEV